MITISHFTVLVIGDDYANLLGPYSENLEVEPYKEAIEPHPVEDAKESIKLSWEQYNQWVDAGEPDISTLANYFQKLAIHNVQAGFMPAEDASDEELVKYYTGDDEVWEEDGIWYKYSTWNENGKWDWYSLGGRWRGYFKPIEGYAAALGEMPAIGEGKPIYENGADLILKKNIDFYGMGEIVGMRAAETWDKYQELKAIHGPLVKFQDFEFDGTDEEKRKAYWEDPATIAYKDAGFIGFFGNYDGDILNKTKEEYIEHKILEGPVTYAVLTENGWYEKGEMGWFGIAANEMDEMDWTEQWWKLVNEAPEDAIFALIDCHV